MYRLLNPYLAEKIMKYFSVEFINFKAIFLYFFRCIFILRFREVVSASKVGVSVVFINLSSLREIRLHVYSDIFQKMFY